MHVHPHTRTHTYTHARTQIYLWWTGGLSKWWFLHGWDTRRSSLWIVWCLGGSLSAKKQHTHTHKQLKYIIFIIISWFISRIRLSIDPKRKATTQFHTWYIALLFLFWERKTCTCINGFGKLQTNEKLFEKSWVLTRVSPAASTVRPNSMAVIQMSSSSTRKITNVPRIPSIKS